MRMGACACAGGVFLCALVCMGDSITVGETAYQDVYISESPTKYLVCVPGDGRIIPVPKSDVQSESLNIVQDREARKALYDKWLAKRNAINGYPSARPHESAQSDTPSPPSEEAPPEDYGTTRKTTRIAGPTSPYYGTDPAYNAQQDDLKTQYQANISAQRRQREAKKHRMLTERRVITSESARGTGVQWNSTAQWNNNGGRFGNNY